MTLTSAEYWMQVNSSVNASASKELTQKTAVPQGHRSVPYANLVISSYDNFNYPQPNESPIEPIENTPTDEDYSNGYMIRYLYRQATNPQDSIKEITPDGYELIQETSLYASTTIRWKLIGKKTDTMDINRNNAEIAERNLEGSKEYLNRNLSLHWRNLPDNFQIFDVTDTLKLSQVSPDNRVAAISNIPKIRREIDTEKYDDIVTQDYEEIIVEPRTTI